MGSKLVGVDWSPNSHDAVVADFDGNGVSDILLQPTRNGGTAWLVSASGTGQVLSNGVQLSSNTGWSSAGHRLVAGNFDGSDGAGVYWQAQSAGGDNSYANQVSAGGISQAAHSAAQAAAVMPATVVGRTQGSFEVSRTGGATYRVPLWMPPGPRGIQPSLELTYDSQEENNGVLGVGWRLSGLSSIQRCKRIAGLDGQAAAVTLTSTDRFCLNGERLQLTSGTYGSANSTYRLETGDFATVTAVGTAGDGPQSFFSKDANGVTYHYGATTDSRALLGPGTPFRWKLNKVVDQYGNNYEISYVTSTGHALPDTISWTRRSSCSTSYLYTAKFNYSSGRSAEDTTFTYVANYPLMLNRRLDNIVVQSAASGIAQTVRKHVFSYEISPVTKRSRMTAIQECADDALSACLSPTKISYQNGQAGVNASAFGGGNTALSLSKAPRDFNGDGRDDLLYVIGSTWHVAFANHGGFAAPRDTGITSAATPIPDRLLNNGLDGLLAPVGGIEWYKSGNLKKREDKNRALAEVFTYDVLDRLDTSTLNGVLNLDVNYSEIGNIVSKSDVGTYAYTHPTKKHAVMSTSGVVPNTYDYDANGNMKTRNGVQTTWFTYNLPKRISQSASTWSEFSYNHARERWKQQISEGVATETMTYIGGLFEKRQIGSAIEYRHLVVGGNGPVAYVERNATGSSTSYVSTDHLAGTSVVTSESGAVLFTESFDAFGRRRGSNWTGSPSAGDLSLIATTTRRGFTFHEHLDNLKLIHMNGRVFDPAIGRFMSADPFVQAPYSSQSLNRYSYTFNNPLTFTDPSGFICTGQMAGAVLTTIGRIWRVACCAACVTIDRLRPLSMI